MFEVEHEKCVFCFFFNDTATTEIYTLSLHDALPILHGQNETIFMTQFLVLEVGWVNRVQVKL